LKYLEVCNDLEYEYDMVSLDKAI